MSSLKPEDIDQLLPQTQCGLCGYGGCMPYAKALVHDDAAINLCPPGGIPTLQSLSWALQKDAEPFVAEMQINAKPKLLAKIREDECIGCTKCIPACPVDAIIGSAKQMHVVIASDCTGCELCIPPCPVDCIDLIKVDEQTDLSLEKKNKNRALYQKKLKRIEEANIQRNQIAADKMRSEKSNVSISVPQNDDVDSNKKNYIQAAILRAKAKKQNGI